MNVIKIFKIYWLLVSIYIISQYYWKVNSLSKYYTSFVTILGTNAR